MSNPTGKNQYTGGLGRKTSTVKNHIRATSKSMAAAFKTSPKRRANINKSFHAQFPKTHQG